jgi:hypothetical protein
MRDWLPGVTGRRVVDRRDWMVIGTGLAEKRERKPEMHAHGLRCHAGVVPRAMIGL